MVVTNVLGVAFTAALLSASDAGVTFVFPQDGATNLLAWSKLSPASREAVCEQLRFVPVPPVMVATFRQTENELRKLAAFEAAGRILPDRASNRRRAIRTAFARIGREKGLDEKTIEMLLRRLGR